MLYVPVLSVCLPGFVFGDGCFEVGQKFISIETDIRQTYLAANKKCSERNGRLLVLDHQVNLTKIVDLIVHEYKNAYFVLWIGLTAFQLKSTGGKRMSIRKLANSGKWGVLTLILVLKYLTWLTQSQYIVTEHADNNFRSSSKQNLVFCYK